MQIYHIERPGPCSDFRLHLLMPGITQSVLIQEMIIWLNQQGLTVKNLSNDFSAF